MNEQDPSQEIIEPVVIEAAVGHIATREIRSGAGTLSDVMGVEAATHYVHTNNSNRRRNSELARRMYSPRRSLRHRS